MIPFVTPMFASGAVPTSADFDGTNDYMTRGAGLTGAADGKAGILSFWLRLDGSDAGTMVVFNSTTTVGGLTSRFLAYRDATNKIVLVAYDLAASIALQFTSVGTYTAGVSWRHFLFSWDVATSRAQLYVDDVSDAAAPTTLVNTTLEYTVLDWSIGGQPNGANKLNGCLAEFYFNTATSLDLSVTSNRRKFRSATGKPVDLGANGSLPTGSQPIVYQRVAPGSAASSFATNLGSGGNFTVTGALSLGSTSPSD